MLKHVFKWLFFVYNATTILGIEPGGARDDDGTVGSQRVNGRRIPTTLRKGHHTNIMHTKRIHVFLDIHTLDYIQQNKPDFLYDMKTC